MGAATLTFVDTISIWALDMMVQHGMIVTILAMLGLFSIISAVGDKCAKAFKYIFMIFIAMPLIIVFGLINKFKRKERLKELGDIKAHLKSHPEKWKVILYYLLYVLFVAFFGIVLLFVIYKFIFPFYELNEATKMIVSNFTNSNNTLNITGNLS